jgi:hypothetical protein
LPDVGGLMSYGADVIGHYAFAATRKSGPVLGILLTLSARTNYSGS